MKLSCAIAHKLGGHQWKRGNSVNLWEACAFDEVDGGHVTDQKNDGGVRLMHWAFGKGVKLINIYFRRKVSHLIVYTLGHAETVVNYILVSCC